MPVSKSQKFQFSPKTTYVNPVTLYFSDTKREGWLCFPSKSEAECYITLVKCLKGCNIDCHYSVAISPKQQWKIDFRVSVVSVRGLITLKKLINAKLLSELTESEFFVEYKGVLDKNFNSKIWKLADYDTKAFNNLILIGKYPTALVNENLTKCITTIKVVHSIQMIKRILS